MPKILVVDDSALDRALVGQILNGDLTLDVEAVDNGHAALERLKEPGFELVVTDLQMPEVSGLQLVKAIRLDHPQIPVILMTAMGSEAIAMEALEEGAASYVPKRELKDRLLDTVQDVLSLSHASRAYEQLINCFDSTQFVVSLENDPELVDPLIDYVQQIATGMGICDPTGGYQLGNALREAILNAIYHGNLEITSEELEQAREKMLEGIHTDLLQQRRTIPPYSERRVRVSVEVTREHAKLIVSDQGPGFDPATLSRVDEAHALDSTLGRGAVLMRTFMDEVTYNETGNQITLIKRLVAADE